MNCSGSARPCSSATRHTRLRRWRLVETAWQLETSRNSLAVEVDVDGLDLVVTRSGAANESGRARRRAQRLQSASTAFVTSELIPADVDHFPPHTLKQLNIRLHLDGIWNLVLACRGFNRGIDGKSCRVPHQRLLQRLNVRTSSSSAATIPCGRRFWRRPARRVPSGSVF